MRNHLADGLGFEGVRAALGGAGLGPGLDEAGAEVAGGGDEEGSGAAGDVRDLEVEDLFGDFSRQASRSGVW